MDDFTAIHILEEVAFMQPLLYFFGSLYNKSTLCLLLFSYVVAPLPEMGADFLSIDPHRRRHLMGHSRGRNAEASFYENLRSPCRQRRIGAPHRRTGQLHRSSRDHSPLLPHPSPRIDALQHVRSPDPQRVRNLRLRHSPRLQKRVHGCE